MPRTEQESTEHQTVLLEEAVAAVLTDPEGLYIDGTFGRGGHSRLLLSRLGAGGRLIGIDKDPQAVAVGEQLAGMDGRFVMVQGSFAELDNALMQAGALTQSGEARRASGLLLDLGVSSPQLDQAERGFSFTRDGALDMRMNPQVGQSAAEWLATAEEGEIARVLKEYGEERFARRIARAVVKAQQETPLTSTLQLAKVIAAAHPAWERGRHPATRSFQAIRIHINNELGELETFLPQVPELLATAGRLVVISFHSLEDRLVKRFIRDQARGPQVPAYIPVTTSNEPRLRALGKARYPSAAEVAANVRARSAVMRVAEKVA